MIEQNRILSQLSTKPRSPISSYSHPHSAVDTLTYILAKTENKNHEHWTLFI